VAEKLIPKNHGFGTRRVPPETRHYETDRFLWPVMGVARLALEGVERIPPAGIQA
jgi:hypothetical protein